MDAGTAVDLMRQAIGLVIVLALPILSVALITALIVSFMQAVTQIQDQTLSIVPKIFAVLISLVIFGPWMMGRLVEFGSRMFTMLP